MDKQRRIKKRIGLGARFYDPGQEEEFARVLTPAMAAHLASPEMEAIEGEWFDQPAQDQEPTPPAAGNEGSSSPAGHTNDAGHSGTGSLAPDGESEEGTGNGEPGTGDAGDGSTPGETTPKDETTPDADPATGSTAVTGQEGQGSPPAPPGPPEGDQTTPNPAGASKTNVKAGGTPPKKASPAKRAGTTPKKK